MESGLRSDIDGSALRRTGPRLPLTLAGDDASSPSPVTYDLPPQTTLIKHAPRRTRSLYQRPADEAADSRAAAGALPYVGYEATRSLSTPRRHCVTPRASTSLPGRATRLAARCALVPIMRAGLGMVESMQALLLNVVHQIGMFKRFDAPSNTILPKHGDSCDIAFILDPVWPLQNDDSSSLG